MGARAWHGRTPCRHQSIRLTQQSLDASDQRCVADAAACGDASSAGSLPPVTLEVDELTCFVLAFGMACCSAGPNRSALEGSSPAARARKNSALTSARLSGLVCACAWFGWWAVTANSDAVRSKEVFIGCPFLLNPKRLATEPNHQRQEHGVHSIASHNEDKWPQMEA
jgi:hypothetical protein